MVLVAPERHNKVSDMANSNTFKDCKECKEHSIGCHSTCEKYKKAKKQYEEEKERIRQSKRVYDLMDDYKYKRFEKERKIRAI